MPEDKTIAVPSPTAFSQSEIRERTFNLAYKILDTLGLRISRLNDLEALLGNIVDTPETENCCPRPDFGPMAEECMSKLQGLQQLVDERLFAGKAFMQPVAFDRHVSWITREVEMSISRTRGFIEWALGKRPGEIPSERRLLAKGPMYMNLAGLYGSSELPSLATSFDSKSSDEVLQQVKGVLETLELLFEHAKAMTLILLSYGKDRFWDANGIRHFLDCAEHLAFLQGFVHNSQRDGLAITKFMVDKFDQSAARLDCCIRAFIMAYDTLPMGDVPTQHDISSLQASCKGKNLDGVYAQYKRDDKAMDLLFRKYWKVRNHAVNHDPAAAQDLEGCADTTAIRKRQMAAETLRERTSRGACSWNSGCSKALGPDFIKDALAILNGLLRADMVALEKLISGLKVLCPN
ncbi:uncharacterized protein NECHADRAFT_85004 [Fusarium vanettenii 77-13-4]|uniref:Uncharacterized protein n=1 Tax=Fusarium vanettenii (strain ATCC MYA-4622 / CBS 123669 / FGSC 9596 / NRRL 45880 / 77-13-4) TaxID=660122 RepID=C7YUQ6_FUSV7|nr:uncharacterized protein NECHADRAFT_85004 [Fusarium vanettenii 77-13-4]EEU44847.1 predicted protein [Fusarium vanettenii 77-13-4]